jgi:hypothetical protein
MVSWQAFATAEPDLAAAGRSLFMQFGVGLAFLATVRKDGGPRLRPVCPVLSGDGLWVLAIAESPKRFDLERDGRYALQTFPQPKPGSDEFYVTGRATRIDDATTRAAVCRDATHQFQPTEVLFELSLERVMHTTWENVLTPAMRSVHRTWRAA